MDLTVISKSIQRSVLLLIEAAEKSSILHQIELVITMKKTAAMYTDSSLMTANPAIGKDAAEFFKNMSIGNLAGQYDYLIVSPDQPEAEDSFYLMDEEIKKGSNGQIIMKMNSVTDVDFIQKVSEASLLWSESGSCGESVVFCRA